jgi:hypothetical protein
MFSYHIHSALFASCNFVVVASIHFISYLFHIQNSLIHINVSEANLILRFAISLKFIRFQICRICFKAKMRGHPKGDLQPICNELK